MILLGDCRELLPTLPAESVQCVVTSPPYWGLRDYGTGSRPGDTVLDPFAGSGTTCYVAKELGRKYVGIELNAEYIALAEKRLRQEVLPL